MLPSASVTASALAIRVISKLAHAARSLPVYASQPGLPPLRATLGSGWSLAFAGRDHPLGPNGRFQLICFLLPQASPGAPHVHSVDGIRLLCHVHNLLAAEQIYGRAFMDRVRRERKEATTFARPQSTARLTPPVCPGANGQQKLF